MTFPTKPNFSIPTTDVDPDALVNMSVAPSIFVNNVLPAKERKKRALKALKQPCSNVGFTGQCHPLADDAEYKTDIANQLGDSKSHTVAAEAHEKAAQKMGEFMGQTGPLKQKSHKAHLIGLKSAHSHHTTRAKAHREVSDIIAKEEAATEQAKKAAEHRKT